VALIDCPECGEEVSDKAPTCPHCGIRVAENQEAEVTAEIEAPPMSTRGPVPSHGFKQGITNHLPAASVAFVFLALLVFMFPPYEMSGHSDKRVFRCFLMAGYQDIDWVALFLELVGVGLAIGGVLLTLRWFPHLLGVTARTELAYLPSCPLCGEKRYMMKPKRLYEHIVCRKCHRDFATRRELAFVFDMALWLVLYRPVGRVLLHLLFNVGASDSEIGLISMLFPYVYFGLFLFKDSIGGRSPGKVLCGVKVVDGKTGEAAGFFAAVRRNLLLAIPPIPLFVAFQMRRGYRLGDNWAKTKVVWKDHAAHPVFTEF
jgi:uncharacterized RDD family membrane protein YckC